MNPSTPPHSESVLTEALNELEASSKLIRDRLQAMPNIFRLGLDDVNLVQRMAADLSESRLPQGSTPRALLVLALNNALGELQAKIDGLANFKESVRKEEHDLLKATCFGWTSGNCLGIVRELTAQLEGVEVQRFWEVAEPRLKELNETISLAQSNHDKDLAWARDRFASAVATVRAAKAVNDRYLPTAFWSGLGYWALMPFIVYVAVAIYGYSGPISLVSAWVASGLLLVSTAGLAILAFRRGRSSSSADLIAVGAGGYLAFFTAAYLLCWVTNKASLSFGPENSSQEFSLFEAAFLSLTVGGTIGPIGINLAACARVVAFIQLLLAGTTILSVITAAWDAITRPRDSSSGRDASR